MSQRDLKIFVLGTGTKTEIDNSYFYGFLNGPHCIKLFRTLDMETSWFSKPSPGGCIAVVKKAKWNFNKDSNVKETPEDRFNDIFLRLIVTCPGQIPAKRILVNEIDAKWKRGKKESDKGEN